MELVDCAFADGRPAQCHPRALVMRGAVPLLSPPPYPAAQQLQRYLLIIKGSALSGGGAIVFSTFCLFAVQYTGNKLNQK